MLIKSLYIRDGLFERDIILEDGVNLIFSKRNSRGKTTLVRLILYALGYSVPSTKKIKFEKCFTKIELILETGNVVYLTRENSYTISMICDGEEEIYILPEQTTSIFLIMYLGHSISIKKKAGRY